MPRTVNNPAPRQRGRPREFDTDQALEKAMHVFHRQGYAATSLDDLATSMGLNRPSLYNAFGNKESIYRQAFDNFRGKMREGAARVFGGDTALPDALTAFYRMALDVYFEGAQAPGCFVFCTAPVEALTHADIREDIRSVIYEIDQLLAQKIAVAQRAGQIPQRFDPLETARIAQSILHSIALRARAGEPRHVLDKLVDNAVQLLCARDH